MNTLKLAESTFGLAPNVMVVDDSTTSLKVMSAILLELGLEPQPISEGKLALAAARSQPPDLVLLDISMPGMNGFEVCRAFKEDQQLREIPIIFISGLSDSRDIVKGLSLGGVDYVTKPFQLEEVAARIRIHLRILLLQRQLRAHNETLEHIVAERTRELAVANRQLSEMGKIKNEFLRMIAHEIRTPANGLLGMSDLIMDSCQLPEGLSEYRRHYEMAKRRLLNLMDDAGLIVASMDLANEERVSMRVPAILLALQERQPAIRISASADVDLEAVLVQVEKTMVLRALETAVLVAVSFSSDKCAAALRISLEDPYLVLCIPLDALHLSESTASNFFDIESAARSSSTAEHLGLSPVVAHKIITALGGDLTLRKDEGSSGSLRVILPCLRRGAEEERPELQE